MALRQTLRNMLKRAQCSGQPARVRLAKGLTVAIKADGDTVAVQLSRADIFPALSEWKTVIQQLPQCVVTKEPKAIRGDVYYLKGQVRLSVDFVRELE